jgi:hypothetical protein
MDNLVEIAECLEQQGLKLAGPLTRRDGEKSLIYAFVEVFRDRKGKQKPTNISLNRISEHFLERGIIIKFILIDVSNLDLEIGLRATLLHAFPNLVRNSFLSSDKQGAVVWVVPKGVAARDQIDEITRRASIFLENAGMTLAEVKLTVDENLPSRTAILSELRIAAPASAEVLVARLSEKGFVTPPIDYLNRHLDALRKADQVVRRNDANYCLTAKALKVLGTIKRRNSPDITRFLDLAQRGDLR